MLKITYLQRLNPLNRVEAKTSHFLTMCNMYTTLLTQTSMCIHTIMQCYDLYIDPFTECFGTYQHSLSKVCTKSID